MAEPVGGVVRESGPGLLPGSTWYAAPTEGSGLAGTIPPGTLAKMAWFTADFLLDGTNTAVFQLELAFGTVTMIFRDMPDVFDTAFADACRAYAEPLTLTRDDPALIGYFLMNEPQWGFTGEPLLCGILSTAPANATRRAFAAAMAARYGSDADLARAWAMPGATLARIAEGRWTEPWTAEAQPDLETFARNTGKPVIIGEWHFGALDAGLPASGIGHVADQADRGRADRAYIEDAAALPWCVGAHWFTLYDQPALGRFDGENYNIGFLDVCHRPYDELGAAARAAHENLYAVAAGLTPPFAEHPTCRCCSEPKRASGTPMQDTTRQHAMREHWRGTVSVPDPVPSPSQRWCGRSARASRNAPRTPDRQQERHEPKRPTRRCLRAGGPSSMPADGRSQAAGGCSPTATSPRLTACAASSRPAWPGCGNTSASPPAAVSTRTASGTVRSYRTSSASTGRAATSSCAPSSTSATSPRGCFAGARLRAGHR